MAAGPSRRRAEAARALEPGPVLGMEKRRPATQGGHPQENVMILALPLAILGAAFLSYVRLATR
ncbi:hypothetical protein AMYX_07520 [Anaeromyxobacter diazotrophicus]|uniref:Uncharacterized protein n=1 Tax=Anaeromyxobacter diazotrophicus TaxID=2590199 RepID=A0A7I9VHZ1_9BACT|nr:hypothetical protein AMYX_07520 [Anaeromyxobacter diazotrophicus]